MEGMVSVLDQPNHCLSRERFENKKETAFNAARGLPNAVCS